MSLRLKSKLALLSLSSTAITISMRRRKLNDRACSNSGGSCGGEPKKEEKKGAASAENLDASEGEGASDTDGKSLKRKSAKPKSKGGANTTITFDTNFLSSGNQTEADSGGQAAAAADGGQVASPGSQVAAPPGADVEHPKAYVQTVSEFIAKGPPADVADVVVYASQMPNDDITWSAAVASKKNIVEKFEKKDEHKNDKHGLKTVTAALQKSAKTTYRIDELFDWMASSKYFRFQAFAFAPFDRKEYPHTHSLFTYKPSDHPSVPDLVSGALPWFPKGTKLTCVYMLKEQDAGKAKMPEYNPECEHRKTTSGGKFEAVDCKLRFERLEADGGEEMRGKIEKIAPRKEWDGKLWELLCLVV